MFRGIILVSIFMLIIGGSAVTYFIFIDKNDSEHEKITEQSFTSLQNLEIKTIDVNFPYRALILSGEVSKSETETIFNLDYNFILQDQFNDTNDLKIDSRDGVKPYLIQIEENGQVLDQTEPFGVCESQQDIVCFTESDVSGLVFPRSIRNIKKVPENIVVLYNGEEIIRESRSENIPTLEITELSLKDDGIYINWEGNDLDNDELLYTVYSWTGDIKDREQVHPNFFGQGEIEAKKKTKYVHKFSENFTQDKSIQFLVVVDDGFHLNWIATDVISFSSQEYDLKTSILSPKDGDVFDGVFSLNGSMQAFIETPGYLRNGEPNTWSSIPHKYEWISDIDGVIASGDTAEYISDNIYCYWRDLTLGDHVLTYKGTSNNGSAETSVNISLKSNPNIPEELNPPRVGYCKG